METNYTSCLLEFKYDEYLRSKNIKYDLLIFDEEIKILQYIYTLFPTLLSNECHNEIYKMNDLLLNEDVVTLCKIINYDRRINLFTLSDIVNIIKNIFSFLETLNLVERLMIHHFIFITTDKPLPNITIKKENSFLYCKDRKYLEVKPAITKYSIKKDIKLINSLTTDEKLLNKFELLSFQTQQHTISPTENSILKQARELLDNLKLKEYNFKLILSCDKSFTQNDSMICKRAVCTTEQRRQLVSVLKHINEEHKTALYNTEQGKIQYEKDQKEKLELYFKKRNENERKIEYILNENSDRESRLVDINQDLRTLANANNDVLDFSDKFFENPNLSYDYFNGK